MKQQPSVLTKLDNQLQETQAEYKAEAVVEEETVTKDMEDKVGAPTVHHTRHQL